MSRSSAESEYRSVAALVSEFVWMIALFKDLGVDRTQPVLLYCDSQAVIHIAANPVRLSMFQLADLLTKPPGHQ